MPEELTQNNNSASELSELVQISGQDLAALDKVPLVDLLVLGVGPVVAGSHREVEDALLRRLLKRQSDGNTPTCAYPRFSQLIFKIN